MKVELKRLQVVARMSEETTCFAADVYVDGKKVGAAKNDGHGGCTFVAIDRAIEPAVKAYAMTVMPEEFKAYKHLDPLEWLVDDLVNDFVEQKERARVAKKVAKVDAQYKATCPTRGTHAARFEVAHQSGVDTRWVEFRGEASVALAAAEKKYGALATWTVIA